MNQMTKIILVGCNGKMGKVISERVAEMPDCMIIAGTDFNATPNGEYPIFSNIKDAPIQDADAIIDFSRPDGLNDLLDASLKEKIPVVICTTGFSKEQIDQINAAAQRTPIFFSGNMSLGINLLIALSKKAATILGNDYDVEIVEAHHNQKVDAPSGTAKMIMDEVAKSLPHDTEYVYDRHESHAKRDKKEIGVHSIRGGTIVGEHEVIFAGPQEILTIKHSALSREIFANGAISAAKFIKGKTAKLYDMNSMLQLS